MPKSMDEILAPEIKDTDWAPIDVSTSLVAQLHCAAHKAAYYSLFLPTWLMRNALYLALWPWRERKGGYVFHTDRCLSRLCFRAFLWCHDLLAWLAGHNGASTFYDCLLGWDRAVPLLGFENGDHLLTLRTLGAPDADGRRGVDFTWLTRTKAAGVFRVLETQRASNELRLLCAWTSGKHAGQTFIIDRDYATSWIIKDANDIRPVAFFAPPSPFKWLLLVALGFVLAAQVVSSIDTIASAARNRITNGAEGEAGPR